MEPDTTISSSSPEASDTLTVLREALRQGDLERLAAQTEYQWIESEHQRATERFSAADAKCKGIQQQISEERQRLMNEFEKDTRERRAQLEASIGLTRQAVVKEENVKIVIGDEEEEEDAPAVEIPARLEATTTTTTTPSQKRSVVSTDSDNSSRTRRRQSSTESVTNFTCPECQAVFRRGTHNQDHWKTCPGRCRRCVELDIACEKSAGRCRPCFDAQERYCSLFVPKAKRTSGLGDSSEWNLYT